MPEVRVQDEQGTIHVFPDGSTPEMIAKAMGVKPPDAQPQAPALPQATVSNAPTGVLPWLQNAENDLRYGTQTGPVGQFLHKLGYTGGETLEDAGHTNAIGRIADSVPVGLSEMAQALPNIAQGHIWQGTKKGVGGALDVAAIPSMIATPAAAEGLSNLPSFLRGLLPSTERAGKAFQGVMAVAKNNPVRTMDSLSEALSNYQKLVDAGGSQSISVRKLLNRVTDPNKGELTYEEARNFYSNISRLSADESGRLTDVMKRAVGQVKQALGDTVQRTATLAGQGQEYSAAMKEYAQASRNAEALGTAGDYLKKQALQKLPWLASVYAGKKIYDATK